MKIYLICLLFGLLVMIAFTFSMALGDDVYINKYYQGVWYKDIVNSTKYYIFWVLPYCWLMILIGTIVLGTFFYGFKRALEKITG